MARSWRVGLDGCSPLEAAMRAGARGGMGDDTLINERRAVSSPPERTLATAGDVAAPVVDIRVVLFTVSDGKLFVALPQRDGAAELPRGLPSPAESLDSAARRIVREATGVREQYLEQLYTLGVLDADAWTIIVSYMGLICSTPSLVATRGEVWQDVAQPPPLSPTDRMVVDYAIFRLRAKLGYTNVAFYLLPERFTLSELQATYETILARRLDKRNFRRRMIASAILQQTDEKRREGSHRPAALYRFRPNDDREAYLTPPWVDSA